MSQQGINRAFKKLITVNHKALNPVEKRLIKLNEQIEQTEKLITHCWTVAPRKENGNVDWDKMETINEKGYNLFCDALEEIEKLRQSKETLITKYDLNVFQVYNLFLETQFRGGSF